MNYTLMRYFSCVLVLFFWIENGHGQKLIDFNREGIYTKVFVETDNFGASYLAELEKHYPQIKVDSIRFSVLNDLAYFWHTRDLDKALGFAQQGLEDAVSQESLLWEGRF